MLIKNIIYNLILMSLVLSNHAPLGSFSIARIQYGGGGDWYSDETSIPNLLEFVSNNTNIITNKKQNVVKIGDNNFYQESYFYLTGHGTIKLSDEEIIILRKQLLEGAFLHADDNYGMDASFRKIMKQVFPDKDFVEIPPSHNLFNLHYKFPNGLPKIHEHDNKRPQALGIFHNKRLVVLYTYESDLGDGWEDIEVHNDPEDLRIQALKMGTNIIKYFLTQ
tara:strand:- start:1954 stop:2616 length:663 start_codon:yes stop_codon:yes gene_type:complete